MTPGVIVGEMVDVVEVGGRDGEGIRRRKRVHDQQEGVVAIDQVHGDVADEHPWPWSAQGTHPLDIAPSSVHWILAHTIFDELDIQLGRIQEPIPKTGRAMDPTGNTLSPVTRILITGHRGLVGSALWRHFSAHGFQNLIGRTSTELDLRDARATADFFADARPDVVIDAAAVVGGIAYNASRQADFFSDNLRIQVNVLDSAVAAGVKSCLFLGSGCIYPKLAEQPIREDSLLTGPLEETNQGFAMAKLAGAAHVVAIRRQYGLPYICAMPANLYGPGDNFNPRNSHVLPAMIRRFHEAVRDGAETVTCWGTGQPRREFLYVDDLAEACHFLLDHYDDDQPINVGSGEDVAIAELAHLVAETVGYRGEIIWDTDRPDGTHRRLLDTQRLRRLGWRSKTSLAEGVRTTYEWFLDHADDYRR
jgi:GDP-L-fucose synthase